MNFVVSKILSIDGLLISESKRDEIQKEISKIVEREVAIKTREIQEKLELSNSEVFRLRRSILDYLQHSDLERLICEAME